jgi:NAD(P)-dependent dehydrogenase (short-subunit alcohol dehydrogenase family)
MTRSISYDYTGARVLVTGGSSGIGHATATAFRDAGAEVVVTGTRERDEVEVDLHGLTYRRLEVRDDASVEAFGASFDRLDVLVNNAGANFPDGGDEWQPDVFEQALRLNLASVFRLSVACKPALVAAGGSVVNLASLSAFRAVPFVPGYAAAKSGVVGLTTTLASAWAAEGIRVNAVAPGVIETRMTEPMMAFAAVVEQQLAHIPLGRFGRPDEITPAILFLGSDAATYLTGQTVIVDGGYATY